MVGKLVFKYTNMEVAKGPRSVRKDCILAGVYANYKDGGQCFVHYRLSSKRSLLLCYGHLFKWICVG